jgi:hypothetical protein
MTTISGAGMMTMRQAFATMHESPPEAAQTDAPPSPETTAAVHALEAAANAQETVKSAAHAPPPVAGLHANASIPEQFLALRHISMRG